MKYINADDLIEKVYRKLPSFSKCSNNDFVSIINSMPSADVVKIVRCKNCIYHDKVKGVYNFGTPTNFIWCNFYSSNRWENGYCNEGKS